MGFILSLFFGFVPMLVFAWILYWLDRFEKEPKILLGVVFVWGAMVAAGVAFIRVYAELAAAVRHRWVCELTNPQMVRKMLV